MTPIPVLRARPRRAASRKASASILLAAVMVASLVATPAQAVFAPPLSTQFDMTGFLQTATLGGPGTGSHRGGTLTVDNQLVTVPAESIVILPANALSWAELFSQAPAGYAPTQTGLALTDVPTPAYTYEVHVIGNRVGNAYIAGLIDIAQQGLNSGAGYINFIDYTTGEFRVGGVPGDNTTGARVRLNDPTGRFGRIDNSPSAGDPRFTVDADNPTVAAATGFPMCIPRVTADPTIPGNADDPLCPQGNRPFDAPPPGGVPAMIIQMNDPVASAGVFPDATKQAPFEVGDYVFFSGTLTNDPAPAITSYVSAHTVTNNVAIYTWPGTNPAYVITDVTIIGTGGLTVIGAGEAAVRTRFEGMTTDPGRKVHLYGIDLNPATGATTDRDWGTIGVDPGAPNGAVKGRWRFRPPCLPFGTVPTKPDKQCVMNAVGTFLPPTREVRAVIEGLQTQVPGTVTATTSANGLFYGQYHAPILEYIFPENIPGTAIVPNNFEALDFLACGGYISAGGTLARQLNPWPGAVAPTCVGAVTAPVVSAGIDQTVPSGAFVALAGTVTGTLPITLLWTQDPADINRVAFSDSTHISPTFTAPTVDATAVLHLTLTATNDVGSTSASMTVTVNAASVPTVDHVPPVTVVSGQSGTIALSGTDPTLPVASLPLTFAATQTPAGSLPVLTVTQGANPPGTGATLAFTAPTLPPDEVVPLVIDVSITATNFAGGISAPETTTITVNPLPDVVTIATAKYRTGKQRLDLTASSTVISPAVTLTLQPYLTEQGTIFNPSGAVFTNGGAGTYTLTLVGVPPPACNLGGAYATPCARTPLIASSNHGGTSAPQRIDTIVLN
jgi:hypothetical protein